MQSKTRSLLAALLVGVLVNVLLRSRTAYLPRAGFAAAFLSIPILAGCGWLFAHCWRVGQCAFLRVIFAGLLFFSSAVELLRLWRLAARLYPDAVSLTIVCLTVTLPVVYLRRVSAISQTANVLLCFVCISTVFMLLSVYPRLHLTNLQVYRLTAADLRIALQDQLTFYPEYLLPALWPESDKRGRHTLLYLAGAGIFFDALLHLVLELFYGAAMPVRIDPLHAAARCGALSIFNRLEWLQLLLWVMVITLKLAVYLYAMVRLLGGQSKTENTAAGLDRFPLYLCGLWLLCALLRRIDPDILLQLRSHLVWAFAALVWIGGLTVCLLRKRNSCC